MGIPNIQQQIYLKKALNEELDGIFSHDKQLDELSKIFEGSLGKARFERKQKALVRNKQRAKNILGTNNPDPMTRLVKPNDPAVKGYMQRLSASVAHLNKKGALRKAHGYASRVQAMRERGRAGMNPRLSRRDELSSSVPGTLSTGGKDANFTGGYEYRENPKRVSKTLKNYRDASWRKMMRGRG